MKKYRSFTVTVVNNGFLVEIGCQKLVFNGLDKLAEMMFRYWDDPEKTEKQVLNDSFVYFGPIGLNIQRPPETDDGNSN